MIKINTDIQALVSMLSKEDLTKGVQDTTFIYMYLFRLKTFSAGKHYLPEVKRRKVSKNNLILCLQRVARPTLKFQDRDFAIFSLNIITET